MFCSVANEHMNYGLKCIECVRGVDMITPQNSGALLCFWAMLYAMGDVGQEEYPMRIRSVLEI